MKNNTQTLRDKIHLKVLAKSKSAKDCGELTVVPLGYVTALILEKLDQALKEQTKNLLEKVWELKIEEYQSPFYIRDKVVELLEATTSTTNEEIK